MFYCRSTIDSIINQILGNVEDIAVDNMTNATVITSEDAIIDSIITDIVELATRRFSPTTPQSPDTNPVVSDLDFNEAHILSSGGSISMTSSTPSITGDFQEQPSRVFENTPSSRSNYIKQNMMKAISVLIDNTHISKREAVLRLDVDKV